MNASRIRLAVAAAAVAVVAVAGCGGSSGGSGGGGGGGGGGGKSGNAYGATKDATIAKSVPQKYASKGALVVATDPTYPPMESVGPDGKTIVGADADLAQALAVTMGLKATMQKATFDSILAGINSGKYDLGMSSFTDTKDREKTVDFVTYASVGTGFFVKKGGKKYASLDQLCGVKVAVEKGTTQQIDSQTQSKKCTGAGKPAVGLQTFTDQNGANLAIQSGRAQVGLADFPVVINLVGKSGGQFEQTGTQYGVAPYGIAMAKGSGLDKPLQAAMQKLIDSGVYAKILKKWGIDKVAITKAATNGATS